MIQEGNPAYQLEGFCLDGGWHVERRVELADDHTGAAFSVGYVVRHESGGEAFLKALDYTKAFEATEPPLELLRLTASYVAERTLLEQCGSRNLDRVVRVLAAGSIAFEGQIITVDYLILEKADSNMRDFIDNADPGDPAPLLQVAHHAVVGLKQLHSIGAFHQDIKPSNILCWNGSAGPSGKLGDLGAAYKEGRPAPHDGEIIAGDASYASPEQLYMCTQLLGQTRWRQAVDAFMLGNCLVFLLSCGVTYNAMLYQELDPTQTWVAWTGTFDDVLPGLVDAHGRVISRIRTALHCDIAETISPILNELCYPDPARRGDPVARRQGQNPYDVHRYITRLNLAFHRAKRSMG